MEQAIRPNNALVSIMHANNEIGTTEPIKHPFWRNKANLPGTKGSINISPRYPAAGQL